MMRRAIPFPAACLLLATLAVSGRAAEWVAPVARQTIYPRQTISQTMLEDRQVSMRSAPVGYYAENQGQIIGKASRQTLLPGMPIPLRALEEPHLVEVGRSVRLVFNQDGLNITAWGQSLQAGAAGDLIRARNLDSGSTVSGIIQSDGTLRVGEQ